MLSGRIFTTSKFLVSLVLNEIREAIKVLISFGPETAISLPAAQSKPYQYGAHNVRYYVLLNNEIRYPVFCRKGKVKNTLLIQLGLN